MDLLPTFVSLAKAPKPKNKIDGVDIRPLLTGNNNAKPRRFLYYYSDKNLECVRKDDWKLVLPHTYESTEGILPGSYGCPGQTYQAQTGYELYDLRKDVGERKNVIGKYPDVANTLWQLAEQARNELGDGSRMGKGQRSPGKVG
jgi:arylsulfatase